MQEMPGEEGFPTYLANRLGRFYERAGRVRALGAPERTGAITVISAISPPGGDATLAHQRHFPAVDWQTSYSLFADAVAGWFSEHIAADWLEVRRSVLELLQREAELREIAGLIGMDALQDRERVLLEAARLLREIVLTQSAYDPVDASCPPEQTHRLAQNALHIHAAATKALADGTPFEKLNWQPARAALLALRSALPEERSARLEELQHAIAQISLAP
jgi:V/A-type H+-transporting ATPase subunit A